MVRLAPKLSLRTPSCCNVDVVKGGAGLRLRLLFLTADMLDAGDGVANGHGDSSEQDGFAGIYSDHSLLPSQPLYTQ